MNIEMVLTSEKGDYRKTWDVQVIGVNGRWYEPFLGWIEWSSEKEEYVYYPDKEVKLTTDYIDKIHKFLIIATFEEEY